MNPGYVNQS